MRLINALTYLIGIVRKKAFVLCRSAGNPSYNLLTLLLMCYVMPLLHLK